MLKSLKFAKQKLGDNFQNNKNCKILDISRGQCRSISQ